MDTIPLRDGQILLDSAVVLRDNKEIGLTPIEERLLRYLAQHPNRVCTRDELLVSVWGYKPGVQSRTIDNAVRRLREKIEVDPANPVHLLAVYGRGVKLQTAGTPERVRGLLGREDELREIEGALAAGHRLISLVGPPGAGKTRLKDEIQRDFTSLALSLRTVISESDVDTLLAAALNLGSAVPERFGAALAARGDLLLVLDSAERASTSLGPKIAAWLEAAPRLRVLLTSRVPLHAPGEVIVEVGPLPEDVAVTLFCERARRAAPQQVIEDSPQLRLLVRGLDRMPLALELAAARVGVLPVAQMVSRLERRLDLLGGSAMRQAIDEAQDDLPPTARTALSGLAVFAGSFTLDDAEAVLDNRGIIDEILILSERGLLFATHPPADAAATVARYALYEIVRDRVRETAPPSSEQIQRHATWYCRLGRRFWEPQTLPLLRESFGELRAARERLLAVDPVLSARCAASLLVLLLDDGPLGAARDLIAQLHSLPESTLPDDLTAELLRCEASIDIESAKTEQAAAKITQALPLEADPHRRTALRFVRVQANKGGGHLDEAAAEILEISAGVEEMPGWLRARYHLNSGFVHLLRAEIQQAERELLLSREHARAVADTKIDAIAADLLSEALSVQGRLAEAAEVSRQAVALSTAPRNEAWCCQQLGLIEMNRGRLEEAEEAFDRAQAIHHLSGNSHNQLTMTGFRAFLLGLRERPAEAETLLVTALHQGSRYPAQAQLWVLVCELRMLAGRFAEARLALETATELAAQGGYVTLRAKIGGWLAISLAHEGDLEGGRKVAEESEENLGRFNLAKHRALCAFMEARFGDPARARDHQQQAELLINALDLGPQSSAVQWLERSRYELRTRRLRLVAS